MNDVGDVVLIYYQDKPAFFARIESIKPDVKKDWFVLELLILTIPLKNITWILREEYINGSPFTMEGKSVRIKHVGPVNPEVISNGNGKSDEKDDIHKRKGDVINLKRHKKKH